MYLSVTASDLNEGNSALTVPDQTEAPSVMETASRSSGRRLATQAWCWTADGLDHSLLPLGSRAPSIQLACGPDLANQHIPTGLGGPSLDRSAKDLHQSHLSDEGRPQAFVRHQLCLGSLSGKCTCGHRCRFPTF
uniref:Uncharacterized protein n=1 Tax=Theropithecus gelada TaxID=9565 RepID=A0A8D2EVR8_THEGE